MQLIEVKTKFEKKAYIDFLYSIYKNDSHFCDMNVIFVKNFLYRQDTYAKRVDVLPYMIYDNNEPKLECMFIVDNTQEIKLSFVEFLPHATKYLQRIVELAQELMAKYDKEKVVVGINGQISYGLGVLAPIYNTEFEFNANYHPEYYTREMDRVFPVVKYAFSYRYCIDHSMKLFSPTRLEKVYQNYQFRLFNIKDFKNDMLVFGKLCHESLKQTPYYSEKTPEEMYELMKKVKFLFKAEDIVFAMKDGKEVGFIYTHPNYAELFNKGKLNYITFFFKQLFKKPKEVIYNVIGVLPEHQMNGVAMNLIHYSLQLRSKDYKYGNSSFILEENEESTRLCRGMCIDLNKRFHLYEIPRGNVECIR